MQRSCYEIWLQAVCQGKVACFTLFMPSGTTCKLHLKLHLYFSCLVAKTQPAKTSFSAGDFHCHSAVSVNPVNGRGRGDGVGGGDKLVVDGVAG